MGSSETVRLIGCPFKAVESGYDSFPFVQILIH